MTSRHLLKARLHMPQGVASMLMGFHLTTMQHEGELNPRNPYNDEHWAFPPVIILRTLSDEADVIKRVNSTWAALTDQAGLSFCHTLVLEKYALWSCTGCLIGELHAMCSTPALFTVTTFGGTRDPLHQGELRAQWSLDSTTHTVC